MYIDVKELPDTLIAALKGVGYAKKDIEIVISDTYSAFCGGSRGRKSFVTAVSIVDGKTSTISGSWGGSNINAPSNQVDQDDTERPIPVNGAVIKGSHGYGPTWARILVPNVNAQALLPAKNELSDLQKKTLYYIHNRKPAYRQKEFDYQGLGEYSASSQLLKPLIEGGYLKVNKRGAISMTTKGKNAAREHSRY